MGNVNKELMIGVLFSSNACAIWSELNERFDKMNGSRMYQLHREIFTLTQGISSVSVYYSRLKDLWTEYDSLLPPPYDCPKFKEFNKHIQYQQLYQFLIGLNEGYNQTRSQMLLKT